MNASVEREYAELLRERHPHSIRTKASYERAMREVSELAIRAKERTPAETEYYRVLCALVADYERTAGAERWPTLDPLDALREIMMLREVTQGEIARVLGDRAAASSILSGRRQISKSQAKKLADLFAVDAGLFI